jgi:hypothetical protein
MSSKKTDSEYKYTISHLGIIRLFAIWGLLESFIFYMTNGNRLLELYIHIFIFIVINIIAYKYRNLLEFL